MSHLVPLNDDGSRKDPSTYSPGELISIASQIHHQQLIRHQIGYAVDLGALETARSYAERAEEPVLAEQCALLAAAPPSIAPAPGAKAFGKAAVR